MGKGFGPGGPAEDSQLAGEPWPVARSWPGALALLPLCPSVPADGRNCADRWQVEAPLALCAWRGEGSEVLVFPPPGRQ